MTLTTWRICLGILYGVGFATASVYVVAYRAWDIRHWKTAYARDASGIIVVLWLVYGWLIYRLVDGIISGRGMAPSGSSLWISLAIFAAVDGYFFQRLTLFLKAMREERRHPTAICRRCGGRGVVPVGTPPDHWHIPWTEDAADQIRSEDDNTPPPGSVQPVG